LSRCYSQRGWTAATIDTSIDFVDLPPSERPIASASAPLFRQQRIDVLLRWYCLSYEYPNQPSEPRLQTAAAICLWHTSDGSDHRRLLVAHSRLDNPVIGSLIARRDPAVVGPMSAGLVRREQWPNHRPLPIIKPEFSCHDPKTPVVAGVNYKEIYFSIA
jgi:hypothetical protein